MPIINFADIKEGEYSLIPEGQYLCKLVEIAETFTKAGDEMWKLTFKIIDGDYSDRLVFDNMIFSKRAYSRVKLICSRLGLDTTEEINLTTDHLKNRKCYINIEKSDYVSKSGEKKEKNSIPFDGYNACGDLDNDFDKL